MNKLKQSKTQIFNNSFLNYKYSNQNKKYLSHLAETKFIVNQKSGSKYLTPHQIISIIYRGQQSKQNILKQLDQLNINTQNLAGLPLNQLYTQCQNALKNTYSVKYLGLSNNQMGIISKRVDPSSPIKKSNNSQIEPLSQNNDTCMITKYFYPKPLKLGKKQDSSKDDLNINNLQKSIKKAFKNNETYEKKPKSIAKNLEYTIFRGANKRVLGSWISKEKKKIHEQKLKVIENNIQNSVLGSMNNFYRKNDNANHKRHKKNDSSQNIQRSYNYIILPHLTYSKAWNKVQYDFKNRV